MMVVHSSTRVWQDLVALLGVLGCMATRSIAYGGLSCHGCDSRALKNLPFKGSVRGALGNRRPYRDAAKAKS
jgi:hypothetical protein